MALKQKLKDFVLTERDLESAILKIIGVDPVNEPQLNTQINNIVSIITRDRNGNGRFDYGDLQLLFNDMSSIVALGSSLVMAGSKIPGFISKIPENAEQTILYLLTYIFLVIVPKQTKTLLSGEEKEKIIDLCYSVYETIKNMGIVQSAVKKSLKILKEKCCTKKDTSKLDNKIQDHNIDLALAVNRVDVERRLMDAELKIQVKRTK